MEEEIQRCPSYFGGFYACNQFGHYVGQCTNENKGKKQKEGQVATSNEMDEFIENIEKEFSLVSLV